MKLLRKYFGQLNNWLDSNELESMLTHVTRVTCLGLRPLGECRSSFLWLITKHRRTDESNTDTWHRPGPFNLLAHLPQNFHSLRSLQHFAAASSVNPAVKCSNSEPVWVENELEVHLMILKARARPLVINQSGDRQTGKWINDSQGFALENTE